MNFYLFKTITMQRYIIINQGYPPCYTEWYDPENHEPADGSQQIVIDQETGKYRLNYGELAGEWLYMEEDHL